MKQYTTPGQTAKLIELGLADSTREERYKRGSLPKSYSIGELIEMLPKTIEEEIWWGDEKGKIGVWGLAINTLGVDYL